MNKRIAVGLAALATVNIVGGALVASAQSPGKDARSDATTVRVGTKSTLGYSTKSFTGKLTLNQPEDPGVEGMDLSYPSALDKYDDAVAACRQSRDVAVRKAKRGTDPKVVAGKSDGAGDWNAGVSRAKGKFYAQVASTKVDALLAEYGVLIKCGSATSRVLKVGR
ncbi:MAG: hypothetical protein ACRDKZ_10460 [Actinomycetota bacterium]